MSKLSVKLVSSRSDRMRFQRMPWAIYRNGVCSDPNWVPPLLSSERELLGWGNHPFYDNAQCAAILAERGGACVGRLAVLINEIHNRRHDESRGFFGFFECINDQAVAHELFTCGERWLRERGMTNIRGPVNPSLNHTCGLLVHGHDSPPRLLMTYNPDYYESLLLSAGFSSSHDLLAYEMTSDGVLKLIDRYQRALQSAANRQDVVLRPMDRRRFDEDVRAYLDIYNRALEGTWGFSPLQPREADRIAQELRHVLVPELAVFAEVAGKPVGAVLALLDYNQILRKLNGRLFPLGILHILAGKRRINTVRTMAITMMPEYQHSGLAVALLSALVPHGIERGIEHWEFSWVLESNHKSRRPLEKCGMKITKTYRLYDKQLA